MTEQVTPSMTCNDCNNPVTLSRKDTRTLVVGCKCDNRSIRVSKGLPTAWSV